MQYVASFDIGTTNTKGALISRDGKILGKRSIPLETIYGDNKTIEQDPEKWWQSVKNILNLWWQEGIKACDVSAIVLTGQMQDCIPIDKYGKFVRNAILYSDSRAKNEAQEIIDVLGQDIIQEKTRNHFNGQMPFAKMLWIKKNENQNYNNTNCFLISSKDYIIRQLTGENITDYTSGATTGMMELIRSEWMEEWVKKFGINLSVLPKLLASHKVAGFISDNASVETGLRRHTPVYSGSGDAGATTIGAGASKVGKVYAYLGTTGWIAVPVNKAINKGSGIFNLTHLPKDLFISIAPLMNAGNVYEWIAKIFGSNSSKCNIDIYKFLEYEVKNTEPGAKGVLFLPYLNGERCPIQDPVATGSFIGLNTSTTMGEMCRSALEGVAMSIRQILELISDEDVKEITLIGGGATSKTWCQIIADVCKTNVIVPKNSEFLPAIGNASSAFVGLGWSKDYIDFTERYLSNSENLVYNPNKKTEEIYETLYNIFLKIYPCLKNIL